MNSPIGIILAGVFCLFTVATFAENKTKTIAGLLLFDDPFEKVFRSGVKEEVYKKNKENKDLTIELVWPNPEADAQYQIRQFENLVLNKKVDAIMVRPMDVAALRQDIDDATRQGIEVIIVDGNAAIARDTKCLAVIGMNDSARGKRVMAELITGLNAKGLDTSSVAIFGGDSNAARMRDRVQGARDEAAARKVKITDNDIVYGFEEQAVKIVREFWLNRPELSGWAMVAGWQMLRQKDAFSWSPKSVFVVAYDDFIEDELAYVQKDFIQVLLVEDVHQWGVKAVDVLYEKIVRGKAPGVEERFIQIEPNKVTHQSMEDFTRNWYSWVKKGE